MYVPAVTSTSTTDRLDVKERILLGHSTEILLEMVIYNMYAEKKIFSDQLH